jgi:hypothetical protein
MTYGCGAESTCKTCYPFTYRCECGEDYPTPVPFGDRTPECEACGLDYNLLLV